MQDFSFLCVRPDTEQRVWIDIQIQGKHPGVPDDGILTELGQCLSYFQTQRCTGLVLRFISPPRNQQPPPQTPLALPADEAGMLAFIRHTQQIAEQITAFPAPSVFILSGACPAGGAALALATDYCITPFSQATENCLAENTLGLHPAPYVIKRLSERVGATAAFNILFSSQRGIILQKEAINVNKFVDACVPDALVHDTVIRFINDLPEKKQAGLSEKLNSRIFKTLTAAKLQRQLEKEYHFTPARHPAPYALLRLWEKHGHRTDENTQAAYARSLNQLINSPQSGGLQRTLCLKNKLQSGTSSASAPLRHLHIIDGGNRSDLLTSFGATSHLIAVHCLLQGITVSLQSHCSEALEKLPQRITAKLTEVTRHHPQAPAELMRNFLSDPQGESIKTAEMILLVDATSLASQQEKFAELEEFSHPDALLATHSSIIPLEKIAAAMLNPERLIGVHFCYPASTTLLVEISSTPATADGLAEQAAQYIRSINKLPLLINNTTGLLVNRILLQYILRGIQLYQQGVPHTVIDKAGQKAGMSYGPLELADKIGLDYCLSLAEALEKAFGIAVPFRLVTMVQTGKLGRKSGSGFYRYRNDRRLKPARVDWDGDFDVLQDKLTNQIMEEAAICLEDGVTEDPDIINAGIIFGTGFAAWTGDPLHFQRNDHVAATTRKHESR